MFLVRDGWGWDYNMMAKPFEVRDSKFCRAKILDRPSVLARSDDAGCTDNKQIGGVQQLLLHSANLIISPARISARGPSRPRASDRNAVRTA